MKQIQIYFTVLILGNLIFATNMFAQEINITGKLITDKGTPVSGATVSLIIAGIETTTDASGNFSLYQDNTGIVDSQEFLRKSSFDGKTLLINCKGDMVSVGIFDLSGKELARVISNKQLTGAFELYPGAYIDSRYNSVVIVRSLVGQELSAFKYFPHDRFSEDKGIFESSFSRYNKKSTSANNTVIDTLVIDHIDFVGKKIPVECQICSFDDIIMEEKTPEAPTGLYGSSESSSTITLNWTDNSDNETGFRIEQSTYQVIEWSEFVELKVVDAGVTSYTDEGLIQGRSYKYRVCAVNNGGNSPYTEVVTVTTQIANPITLSGPSTSTGSFSLEVTYSWPGMFASTSDRFELEESTTPTGDFVKVDNSPWNQRPQSYTFNLAKSSGTYYYRARAYNMSGFTDYTEVISVSVNTPVQTADLKVVNNTRYPMIDVRLNNQQQVGEGNAILQGDNYTFEFVSSGTVNYILGVGFWDGSSRNVWFLYSGNTQVTMGTTSTITFNNPTISQLLSGFSTYRDWTGEYWVNLNMYMAGYRFYSDGSWRFYDNGTQTASGNVTLVSWPDNAVIVTFKLCPGCDEIYLSYPFGQFQLSNGPASWPIIQYTAQ